MRGGNRRRKARGKKEEIPECAYLKLLILVALYVISGLRVARHWYVIHHSITFSKLSKFRPANIKCVAIVYQLVDVSSIAVSQSLSNI